MKQYSGVMSVIAILIAIAGLYLGIGSTSYGASGSRFPNGISADTTSPSSGQVRGTTLTITATSTTGSQGTFTYFTDSGVDKAIWQGTLVSTSSMPQIVLNPWGATTTVALIAVDITSGILGNNSYDVATTTGSSCTGSSASSTPAFIYARSVSSNKRDVAYWTPQIVASSTLTIANSRFSDIGNQDGVSPFFLAPADCLVMRIATSSPGTFSSYWGGTFSATFIKQ